MRLEEKDSETGLDYGLTPPGKASFEWALLFATVALLFPVSGVVGIYFADRSRRRRYPRWRAAAAMSLWCALLGLLVRLLLHIGLFP
jgi:hypothetical protein